MPPVQTIDTQTLGTWLMTGKAVLIDVREPDEFKAGHIPSALSLPLSNLAASIEKLNLPKETHVVFQCLSGKRGENACVMMHNLPLAAERQIYNLEGGIGAWQASGFPVIGAASKMTVFRQVQMIVGGAIALSVVLGFVIATGFFILAGLFGIALVFAGMTGWCGLAMLLEKMPWNR
jgi:rhodanese-related sulfurtransferase